MKRLYKLSGISSVCVVYLFVCMHVFLFVLHPLSCTTSGFWTRTLSCEYKISNIRTNIVKISILRLSEIRKTSLEQAI